MKRIKGRSLARSLRHKILSNLNTKTIFSASLLVFFAWIMLPPVAPQQLVNLDGLVFDVATLSYSKQAEVIVKNPPVAQAPAPEAKLPTPQQKASPLGDNVERWRPIVAQYDWDVDVALAIMKCESGGNPAVVSATNDYGLFQIHDGEESFGKQVYDPAANVRIAYQEYYMSRTYNGKIRAWTPWATWHNGCYRRYVST